MRYKKQIVKNNIELGAYPVYAEDIYWGHEPFKVVGIREDHLELEGDYSGGTHNVTQRDWINIERCFMVSTVCEEQLKPSGCQIRNVCCCGGGETIKKHVNKYWENLI